MKSKHPPLKTKRYHELDGLRGMAALMVAIGHSFLTIQTNMPGSIHQYSIATQMDIQSKLNHVIIMLTNGGVAVGFFFLMSGFVLAESLRNDASSVFSIRKYISFYIRRFFRLYPIFAITILVTAFFIGYFFTYRVYPASAEWFQNWFVYPTFLKEVISNLIFRSTSLSGVIWTLKVEIYASLLFPLLFIVSSYTHKYIDLLIVIELALLGYILNMTEVSYLYIFYIGVILPKWKEQFLMIQLGKYGNDIILILLFAIALVCMSSQVSMPYILIPYIIMGVFVGMLVYSPTHAIKKVFQSTEAQFLGRISYSFYLLHFLILYILALVTFQLINNSFLHEYFLLSQLILAILSIGITVAISFLSFKYIEQPAIRLGNKISTFVNSYSVQYTHGRIYRRPVRRSQ